MLGKTELVAAVAKKAELTKADALKAVDAVLDTVTETLAKGDEVRLLGFLNLKVVNKAARVGHNPKTGAEIKIPATKAVSVKVGASLKKAVK